MVPMRIFRCALSLPTIRQPLSSQKRCLSLPSLDSRHHERRRGIGPWIFYPTCAVILGTACFVAYETSQPFRHTVLAVVRCSRVAGIYGSAGSHSIPTEYIFCRCCNAQCHRLQDDNGQVVRIGGRGERCIFRVPRSKCEASFEGSLGKRRYDLFH